MANKFDEILGKTEKPSPEPTPESVPVSGSFSCQFCSLEIDEANYYPTESLLVWACSAGHMSKIEGFDLM